MKIRLIPFILFVVVVLRLGVAPKSIGADFSGWATTDVPASEGWSSIMANPPGEGAFGWYRTYFEVPAEWAGSRVLLMVGEIKGVDQAFINGELIGANGSMPPLYFRPASSTRRPFVIEPDQLHFGEPNLIAWRVYSEDEAGGIVGGNVHLTRLRDAIDLKGNWLFRAGDDPAWADWFRADADLEARRLEFGRFREKVGVAYGGALGKVAADEAGMKHLVDQVSARFEGNMTTNARNDDKGKPLDPYDALGALQASDDLSVALVLSEPEVSQPLYIDFDERGRLWLTEYRQYPNPAGLEVLTWDNHLRKVFDRVPPPPPYDEPGKERFRGRDVVSIHEDRDGDGVYETHKDFLTGLNMVTSTTRGRGGVWVLNPPYLLFYPDEDGDDVPDSDPIVHLSGFGLEDTHSIANSLKYGPDGWLYGATGSTVTARVRALLSSRNQPLAFFGQSIWRYHPQTFEFELFAEGGWNNFGVDFDDKGRLYSGTNGRQQAVYFVQGGFYQKSFGKHGPHTNPYSFGHFYGLPIEGEQVRLVHQWILYQSGAIPRLEDHFVGVNALGNKLHALEIHNEGSRFTTVEVANPLTSQDRWFRPVHCAVGPDGAIYIADFYDARITHVDPRDNWDRKRGRVYRLRAKGTPLSRVPRLADFSAGELVEALSDPNQWTRRTAQRVLADRQEQQAVPLLVSALKQTKNGQLALEALWALHGLTALTHDLFEVALDHKDPFVRIWAVRLLGDRNGPVEDWLFQRIVNLAGADSHPEVLSQIAATAKRLPAAQAMPLVQVLSRRDGLAADPYVPQQLWWAMESALSQDLEVALSLLKDADFWQGIITDQVLAEKIGRRLMAGRTADELMALSELLELNIQPLFLDRLLSGMDMALAGSFVSDIPVELDRSLGKLQAKGGHEEVLSRLSVRLRSGASLEAARAVILDRSEPVERRLELIERLLDSQDRDLGRLLVEIAFDQSEPERLRMASIHGFKRCSSLAWPELIVTRHRELEGDVKKAALSLLWSQRESALLLLRLVDSGGLSQEGIPSEALLVMSRHESEEIDFLIEKHWGNLRRGESEKTRKIADLRHLIETQPGSGDEAVGRRLFEARCGICHELKGVGREIGPSLTGYEFGNVEFIVSSIVNPNLGVREGYELATLTLRDAQETVFTGFLVDESESKLTVRDLTGHETVLAKSQIGTRRLSPVSIMPEGLLDDLSPSEILSLYAFFRGP